MPRYRNGYGALAALAALAALGAACALGSGGGVPEGAPLIGVPDGCSGLACKRVRCGALPTTRVTERVTDPAGLRGLYNVAVYVPNGPVAPIQHGARCDRCATRDVVSTLSDAHGEFALDDVPADSAVMIVIEIGGFRRVVKTDIAPCTQTRLPDDAVRLPRNAAEGELPMIAATTGASDALECLLRNIGIDDAELTSGDDDERGHVHLFRGKGGGGLRSHRSSSRWSSCSSIHSRASTTIASDRSLRGELARDARAS